VTGHDRIRPATLDDADAIAGLVSMLGYPTTPAAMRARLETLLANADHVTLVAEASGRAGPTAAARGTSSSTRRTIARMPTRSTRRAGFATPVTGS
jgi:hypothetical protein